MATSIDFWSAIFNNVDFERWREKNKFLRRIDEKLYEKVAEEPLHDPCDIDSLRLQEEG